MGIDILLWWLLWICHGERSREPERTQYRRRSNVEYPGCIRFQISTSWTHQTWTVQITSRYAPDIDPESICDEYEDFVPDFYMTHSSNVQELHYYDLWSEKLRDKTFKRLNKNLYVFVEWFGPLSIPIPPRSSMCIAGTRWEISKETGRVLCCCAVYCTLFTMDRLWMIVMDWFITEWIYGIKLVDVHRKRHSARKTLLCVDSTWRIIKKRWKRMKNGLRTITREKSEGKDVDDRFKWFVVMSDFDHQYSI